MHLYIEKDFKDISCFSSKSIEELYTIINTFSNFSSSIKASLHVVEDEISCEELLEIKNTLLNLNISLTNLYSNSRELLICANQIKVDATLIEDENFRPNILNLDKQDLNSTHVGVVRSGDKISSNGNLIIIGDVNPGAYISAKKNIYVWGKLCGVAFAGKNGDDNCSISSLFLNPLQLRINKIIAIGPKEKPISNYPEIASLELGKIVIKPLIINT